MEARYRETPATVPFVVHAAEGTDECAASEVRTLNALGAVGANTVVVHGVGLAAEGLALLKQPAASLVWCPTSNQFTLGQTLSAAALDCGVPIALGTDSALTAAGDMADETAAAAALAGWPRVYRMVTAAAAEVLRLDGGADEIREDGSADLLLLEDRGQAPANALADLRPEAVFVRGELRLISRTLVERIVVGWMKRAEPLDIEGRGAWLVDCFMAAIREPAMRELGPCFRLAGRRVAC